MKTPQTRTGGPPPGVEARHHHQQTGSAGAQSAVSIVHAPTDTRGTLDYALAYAARGWPVFVLSRTKRPLRNCEWCRIECRTPAQMEACTCLTCHGLYAATTSPERIRAMVNRHPAGLLAVRTGAASGLVVIDVDPPAGLATLAALDAEDGPLPGTLMQMTGRPYGLQMLYRHPGGRIPSSAGALGPGVDVKADGGYVIVPPSIHPRTGRRYRWAGDGRWDHPLTPLPARIAARLRPEPAPPARRPARVADVPRGRLRGLLEVVLAAPQGERNSRLYWAACRCAGMVATAELDAAAATAALAAAAAEIGLPESEARRTIASGLRRRGA